MTIEAPSWNERPSPTRLEGRFDFADYVSTREFLDSAAQLSKSVNVYPDVSFGRTYVNMTLHLELDAAVNEAVVREYARKVDEMRTVPIAP